MSSTFNIPTNYTFAINPFNLTGGVGVDVALTGSKTQPVTVDLGLDNIKLDLDLDLKGSKSHPIAVDLGLDNVNVCLSLGITELPRIQVHVPTRYDFGFCLFGMPVFNFRLAGETMLVTQDNPPRLLQRTVKPRRPDPAGVSPAEEVAVTVLAENEPG